MLYQPVFCDGATSRIPTCRRCHTEIGIRQTRNRVRVLDVVRNIVDNSCLRCLKEAERKYDGQMLKFYDIFKEKNSTARSYVNKWKLISRSMLRANHNRGHFNYCLLQISRRYANSALVTTPRTDGPSLSHSSDYCCLTCRKLGRTGFILVQHPTHSYAVRCGAYSVTCALIDNGK